MPWKLLANKAEILAIHAAYMGFGQILYFGGDQHVPENNVNDKTDASRLFDCGSLTVTYTSSPKFDTFCSGHAFLGAANEVKLLVAGGTEQFDNEAAGLHHGHFPGLRNSAEYNSPNVAIPSSPGWFWRSGALMNGGQLAPPSQDLPNPDPNKTGGRWYPTLLTLPTGNVIAVSGHPGSSDASHSNDIPEIFSRAPEPAGNWRRLADYGNAAARTYYEQHAVTFYPRLHVLPSGDILCTNPIKEMTVTLLPDVGPFGGAYSTVCKFPPEAVDDFGGFGSTSVLLPLRYKDHFQAKVVVCGGTSATAYLLDLKSWKPSSAAAASWGWRPTGPRPKPLRRVNGTATLLPTGQVFVNGGIDVGRGEATVDAKGVLEPEIYDPYADQWDLLHDPASTVRNYHSVALLMPDGRVWTAGSDIDAARGLAARNLNIELYEPWYYGNPGRPNITAAPSLAYPGDTIYLESTYASEIERVVLLRCGSCTHAFNPDQRMIELLFRYVTGDVLLAVMPPDNGVLVPGPYLIYTIRKNAGTLGLPSYGTDIYIVPERKPNDGRPGNHGR